MDKTKKIIAIAMLMSVLNFSSAFANNGNHGKNNGNPNSPQCSSGEAQCPAGRVPQCMGNDAMSIVTCSSNEERAKCCDTNGKCTSERISCLKIPDGYCPCSLPSGVSSTNLAFYVDAMNIDGSGFNSADSNDRTTIWDDLSGNATDGLLTNFTFQDLNTGWEGANRVCNPSDLEFDGVNDFVNIGNPDSLNIPGNETIALWVKFKDPSNLSSLFSDFDANKNITQGNLRVGNNGSTIGYTQTHTDGTTLSFDGSDSLSANTWYNIALIRNDNSKTIQLYLNGQPYGNSQNYVGKTIVSSNLGNKAIGRAGSFDGNYFNGKIANVRVYNAALTGNQVNINYNAEVNNFQNPTPSCP
jgi:hypothetical protein